MARRRRSGASFRARTAAAASATTLISSRSRLAEDPATSNAGTSPPQPRWLVARPQPNREVGGADEEREHDRKLDTTALPSLGPARQPRSAALPGPTNPDTASACGVSPLLAMEQEPAARPNTSRRSPGTYRRRPHSHPGAGRGRPWPSGIVGGSRARTSLGLQARHRQDGPHEPPQRHDRATAATQSAAARHGGARLGFSAATIAAGRRRQRPVSAAARPHRRLRSQRRQRRFLRIDEALRHTAGDSRQNRRPPGSPPRRGAQNRRAWRASANVAATAPTKRPPKRTPEAQSSRMKRWRPRAGRPSASSHPRHEPVQPHARHGDRETSRARSRRPSADPRHDEAHRQGRFLTDNVPGFIVNNGLNPWLIPLREHASA